MQVGRKNHTRSKSIIALLLAIIMAFPVVLTPNAAHAATSNTSVAKELEYLKHGLVAILMENGVFFMPKGLEEVKHFSFGSEQVAGAQQIGSTLYTESLEFGFNRTAGLGIGATQMTVPVNSAFQVSLPNANYRVTVKVGHETQASLTGIKSEYVQKFANTRLEAGEVLSYSYDIALVDNLLDFTFTGTANNVKEIVIEKYPAKTAGLATTIYMAGDSTMQSYSSQFAPQQGWGQKFGLFFTEDVVVKNYAIGGRSSKSFLFDGRLDNILQEIKPGDYFFISFGHNDASAAIPERYASPTDYKMYLKRYIDGAKQRGATPILLTPVGRRDYNIATQKFNASFGDYVQAAKEAAEQNDVQLIDLSQLSIAYFNKIGFAATEHLFLFTKPGEYSRYPNGVGDSTHFKELGAEVIAQVVAEMVKVMGLSISRYVVEREIVIPEPGAQFSVFEEDFEDEESPNGYTLPTAPGNNAGLFSSIVEIGGSQVLELGQSGASGPRGSLFHLNESIAGNRITVNFDWNVSAHAATNGNEGRMSVLDSNGTALFSFITSLNGNAPLQYVVGPNLDNRTTTEIMSRQWVNVDLTLRYQDKAYDLIITSKEDEAQKLEVTDIPFPSGVVYQEDIRSLRFEGTRYGGGPLLNWTTHLDNITITGEVLPPKEGDKGPLTALYDELKALNLDGYTTESAAVLTKALARVEEELENLLTQDQVNHLMNVLGVARDSLSTATPTPVTEYKFDFGSGDAEDGYIKVDATRAYIEGNGYGFNHTSLLEAGNRETGNALEEDFIRTGASTFHVELEPANYHVQLIIGDTEATNAAVVTEQMTKVAVDTIPANEYRTIEYDIALIDGVFDFEFSGTSAKVNALTITKLAANVPADKPTVYLASDSTVANYAEGYRPQSGWGEQLQQFIDSEAVTVDNRAVGGLSSKTFIVGGYLNNILLDIRDGDYLFMQWSHNDSTPSRPERYLTPSEFKVYLKTYIDGVSQRGATPVLVTPVNRRDFTGATLNKSFPDYVAAMKEVATETNTLLLDLNQASWEKFKELGPEGTKDVFMWVGTTEDNTHLQVFGATLAASMVAQLLQETELAIAEFVTDIGPIDPDPTDPTDPTDPEDLAWATGILTGPSAITSGHTIALNVGVADKEQTFNTVDLELQYDPAKVEIATVQAEDGSYELAPAAITVLDEKLQVIGTSVIPDTGRIRVILLTTGVDGVIAEAQALFTLNGKIKSGLPNGDTEIRVVKFEAAADGKLGSLNMESAELPITILAAAAPPISGGNSSPSTPDDDSQHAQLEQAIKAATLKAEQAVEGVKVGQYKAGAIAKLQTAIRAAKANGNSVAAFTALKEAVAAFNNECVTLSGAGPISIADLSILMKYYGVTSNDAIWPEIEKADVLNANVIDIRTLAAIAQMIESR